MMSRYYLTAEQTGQRDVAPRPFFVEDRAGNRSWLEHEHLSWQEGVWPEEEYRPAGHRIHGPVARDYPAADLYGDYTDEPRLPSRGRHPDWVGRELPGQILREFFDWGEHEWFARRGSGRTRAEVPDYRGLGPKNYRRPDERITEEICERLTDDPLIDASDIRVTCQDGHVRLTGCVDERPIKYRVEDIVADCAGVTAIRNELRVDRLHPRGTEDTDNPLRR